ncbi:MAG: hypothetical protein JWQ48_329 [Conexibacter sp.]|jgi:hypothetical protein|nr:hypothetical protein [Conexibacter sp.]
MRRLLPLIAIVLAALVCGVPATAGAASSNAIYTDCEHSASGLLTGSYAKSDLQKALNNMPTDLSEYSGCYDAIKQALADGAKSRSGGGNGTTGGGGTGGSGTGGGSSSGGGGATGSSGTAAGSTGTGSSSSGSGTGGSPGSAGAAAAGGTAGAATPAPQHTGTDAPVRLANTEIRPGTLPAISRNGHALPTPLIVFLALLGAGGLAIAGSTIGRRVLARRRP